MEGLNKRLEGQIEKCMKLKEELAVMKKVEKVSTDELKEMLAQEGLEKCEVGNIKLSYKDVVKSEMDEEKLIEILKNLIRQSEGNVEFMNAINGCMNLKITVDEDKVKDLIYEGLISADDLREAYKETTSKRLTLKRVK